MTFNLVLTEAQRLYALVGPAGVALVALSVISLALIVVKLATFAGLGGARSGVLRAVMANVENGQINDALDKANGTSNPIVAIMRPGLMLAAIGAPLAKIEAAVRAAAAERFARLARHHRALEIIGLIAPLLGLLGTILGMIKAFQALQESGAEADPALLAGGIWEALLTTAMGLVVAIPAIIVFNLAETRLDRLREEAAAAVDLMFASLEAGHER